MNIKTIKTSELKISEYDIERLKYISNKDFNKIKEDFKKDGFNDYLIVDENTLEIIWSALFFIVLKDMGRKYIDCNMIDSNIIIGEY